MERKALGKGISALIPEKELSAQDNIKQVPLNQIRPSPLQPREDFDPQSLEELTQSIKEKGVIQPILVRRRGDYYELIAGERRFRAANILNLKEIPVIIKDVDDRDSLELSLIENIQRQNLNPMEEARAYQYLIDKFQLTQDRLSEVLGKARVSVTNTLRLLKLPKEIQDDLRKNRLSFAHGRALLEIEDLNQQRRLAMEAISRGLSVRELESLVKSYRGKSSKQKIRSVSPRDPHASVMEHRLQQALATKVRVAQRAKRGHILIEFYSPQDLERIVKKVEGV
jgi:ParB family chromosome partitioning protein